MTLKHIYKKANGYIDVLAKIGCAKIKIKKDNFFPLSMP